MAISRTGEATEGTLADLAALQATGDAASAWTVKASTALAASLVLKAAPGVLRSVSGRVDSTAPTATYYLQLFDSATLPADTTATTAVAPAPQKVQHVTGTDSRFSIDLAAEGVAFAAGIVFVISSTEFTKTIAGAYLSLTAELL